MRRIIGVENLQKCHSIPNASQKETENSIFLKKLGGVEIAKNSNFSLSYNTENKNLWKIRFLAKIQPKQKEGGL